MTTCISSCQHSVLQLKCWFLVVITCLLLVQGTTPASIDCNKCPTGTYVEKPCDGKMDTVCKPCPQGTYNRKTDLSQSCGDCSHCATTTIVTQECTPRTDTVCGCPPGMVWKSFGADGMCSIIKCKKCPNGTYAEKVCDGKMDTVCKPCSRGTYNHNSDLSQSCGECSPCKMTQIVISECTSTTDTVCGCPEGMVWESFGADGMYSMFIQKHHHDKSQNPPVTNSSGYKISFSLSLGLLLLILYAVD